MAGSSGVAEAVDQRPRLLIVGASVRAAAQSAIRGGYRMVAADLFADQDLRACAECIQVDRYPSEFLEVRAAFSPLPLLYTGALENYPALLHQLAQGSDGPLLGNGGDVVRRVRDPFRVRETLRQFGIPVPELCRRPPTADQARRWLRKPLRSAGGRGVQRGQSGGWRQGDRHDGYFFQRFVPGLACSAAFLATPSDCQLLGVTEMLVGCQWAGAADFIYCGSIQAHTPPEQWAQWKRIGQAIAREFALRGLFGVDGVLGRGTIWPIEINPRYTASMELLEPAVGSSLVALHVEACRGESAIAEAPRPADSAVRGKSILFAPHTLRLDRDFGNIRAARGTYVQLADRPAPGAVIHRRRPILTLIATAASREDVLQHLRSCTRQLLRQTTRIG